MITAPLTTTSWCRQALVPLACAVVALASVSTASAQACFADGSRVKVFEAHDPADLVPLAPGAHTITVTARGGAGGRGYEREGVTGATVTGTFDGVEGDLVVLVGQDGESGRRYTVSGETGGPYYAASGGGGGSAVALWTGTQNHLLVVAGGAGGSGANGIPYDDAQPGQAILDAEAAGGREGDDRHGEAYVPGGGGGFGHDGGDASRQLDQLNRQEYGGGQGGALGNGSYRYSGGGVAMCGFDCSGRRGGRGFGGGGSGGGKARSSSGAGGGGGGYRGGDGGDGFGRSGGGVRRMWRRAGYTEDGSCSSTLTTVSSTACLQEAGA